MNVLKTSNVDAHPYPVCYVLKIKEYCKLETKSLRPYYQQLQLQKYKKHKQSSKQRIKKKQ